MEDNFSMDRGARAKVLGWLKCITFKLTSCCAAWFLTGPDGYQSAAQRLRTPGLGYQVCGLLVYGSPRK